MHRINLLGALLLCILLCGCGGQNAPAEKQTATFFAMDTIMELTVYGDSQLPELAQQRVAELESLLSVTDAGSEIYAANHSGRATLSPDTAALLADGLALCARTDGALDLSIYPVVSAWGFTTGDYRVPDAAELAELLKRVDYRRIAYDARQAVLEIPAGMEIDLGSVAKGYTGDQLLALFREAGVTSALLNLGGNVQTLGAKPDGAPWRIAVRNPFGADEDVLGVLDVTDKAVITSGGYERYFTADGQTYWHILNPASGYPAQNGLVSVTVVGDSGVLCDGLSTALFVMGLEDAAAFWRASDDFEAVFVLEDGRVFITEGLESVFTLAGRYAAAPLTVIRHD